MGENIVEVLRVCGASDIFLLFCDHQDTESESREMEIGVSWTNIHPEKYQRLYGKMISILHKMGEKYCGNYSYLWS